MIHKEIIGDGTNKYENNIVYDANIARQLFVDNKYTLEQLRIMKHQNIKEALTKDNHGLLSDSRIALVMLEGTLLDKNLSKEIASKDPMLKTKKLRSLLSDTILAFYGRYYEKDGTKKVDREAMDVNREKLQYIHKKLCKKLLIEKEVYG